MGWKPCGGFADMTRQRTAQAGVASGPLSPVHSKSLGPSPLAVMTATGLFASRRGGL